MFLNSSSEKKMKIAIWTQYRENYGAHDWDGVGECPQYWKSKGGSCYVIENIEDSVNAQLLVQSILPMIESSDNYQINYMVDFGVFEDDKKVVEDWESPTILKKINGEWVATTVTINDEYGYMNKKIKSKTDSYKLEVGGKTTDHKVLFELQDGNVVSYKDLEQFLV